MFTFSDELIERLAAARRISALTGAGISAESGVATFRGEDGLWQKFNPEELASMNAFMRNPDLVWEWYEYRRKIVNSVQPNPGHRVLAEMEASYPHFSISTQNVDGLHQRAGSKKVHELHGNILRSRCSWCEKIVEDMHFEKGKLLPRCSCRGFMRPDVVWFGEMLPPDVLEAAFADAAQAEVYFSLGTSAVVHPAAMLPTEARNHGAFVVEINLESTPLSREVHESILGKSGAVLPALWSRVKQRLA